MNKYKGKRYIFPLCSLIVISVLYFLVPIIVMPDSTEYYNYLKIFYGLQPLSEWNVVRGFSLPLVLFLITKIFGNTSRGLLIGTYIFFLVLIVTSYFIYINIKERISNKYIKCLITVLYYMFIPFNPILYGYFHGLLSEFVAIPMALVACVIAYKFLQSEFQLKQKRTYFYTLFYIVIFIFCWFLKQPYFTIALFPLLIAIFLSIFKYKSWKDIIYRVSVLLISLFCLFVSINIWRNTLVAAGVNYDDGRNSQYFLKSGFINGISYFRIEDEEWKYSLDYLTDDKFISNEELLNIKNKEDNKFYIINVYDNDNNIIDKLIMFYDGEDYSTQDSIKLYLNAIKKHPLVVLNSYRAGYLASIDYYISQRDKKGNYYPITQHIIGYSHENNCIGLAFLNRQDNMLWINPNTNFKYVENLKQEFYIPFFVKVLVESYSNLHKMVFTITFLILPFVFLLLLYLYLFKKKRSKKYELAIIFITFAFLHTIFHVVMGAIIDRYIFVVFVEAFIGLLILFLPDDKDKNYRKIKVQNISKLNHKLLNKLDKHKKIKYLYKKYEEIIKYVFFGGLTTIVSLFVKWGLLFTILDAKNELQLQFSIIISWIAAVTFAYVTNRKFVFKSKNKDLLKEISSFFGSRMLTLIMEMVIMWFFVSFLHLNTKVWIFVWTLVTQILIIVGNYILSKMFVFNKKVRN